MAYKTANEKVKSKIPNKTPKLSENKILLNLNLFKKMCNTLSFPEKYVKTNENACKPFFEGTEIWMSLYLMK